MSTAPITDRKALAVVLAAGEGTRMKSSRPKVLHEVAGRPMLAHVLASVGAAGIEAVAVVIGPGCEEVRAETLKLRPDAQVFVQEERRGTAHAVLAARDAIGQGFDDLIVLFADTPLVEPQTILALRKGLVEGASVVALGFHAADPFGYGRLLTDGSDRLVAIREEKDASESERAIRLVNAGLMAIDGRAALSLLEAIGDDKATKECYLTDVVGLVASRGGVARVVLAPEEEVQGVNDRAQLARVEATAQARLRREAMIGGATLIAPETVFLSADAKIGRDVLIEPHVVIGKGVTIADGAVIRSFSHLEGASVGEGAVVGPFARLRPKAVLAANSKVGNFVEIKAANIGEGAKINHLTYIGDAEVGARANVGAGVITCNYDGFFKYRTEIGAGAFVGSNSALVAPVKIGAGAYVGSGSVITKDVSADALAIGRGRQIEKAQWAVTFRAAQKAKKDSAG
jgi:bifunctional UDP-N-acetylglucosamine pyrophosphorylase/glucosamine-1-phosphate N-acetyltransferase